MHAVEQASCPNKDCPDHGRINAGNIALRCRYGKNRDRLLYYCRTCGKRFAATRGTPLFASHLPKETIHSIIHHISRGESMRSASRLSGVPKATCKLAVDKLEAFLAKCFREMTDTLELEEEQVELLWMFLKRLKLMRERGRKCPPAGKAGGALEPGGPEEDFPGE